jgi:hypothetical protein
MLLLIYAFTLWLGVYLLRRNGHKPGMRDTGAGLIFYAVGLGLAHFAARGYQLAAILPAVCWFFAVQHFRAQSSENAPQRPRMLLVTATIFFSASTALLVIPQPLLTGDFALALMGIDLLLLGYSIAALDAYDEGEALLPDALRSFALTAGVVVIFAGQVAAVIAIEGASPALERLLWGVLTTAVILPTFAPAAQSTLDKLFLAPNVQTERAELQAVYNALPRRDETLNLLAMDETEFARLTRRALSHIGDLERLAASPLIHLPMIDSRLQAQGKADSTLNRATELKRLLIESIERLKPSRPESFGTSDEWRYYNALYFPYVVGLKPFRVGNSHDGLDTISQNALDWFQAQVPERTLHNWQNKAAQLIARDLREYA